MSGTIPPEGGVSPRTMVQVVESQFVVVLRGQEQFKLNCEQQWLQGREAMQQMVTHHHAEAAKMQQVQQALQQSELNAQEEARCYQLCNQIQSSELVAQQQINRQLTSNCENFAVEYRAHAAQQLPHRIMKEGRSVSILRSVGDCKEQSVTVAA